MRWPGRPGAEGGAREETAFGNLDECGKGRTPSYRRFLDSVDLRVG
jgi:hypothetical protein